MLIEIHMLQNHAPANLNRDDSNSPKDCVFGGYRRARISSQCLKRTIRQSEYFKEAIKELGFRTRKLPELIKEALIKKGVDKEVANIIALSVSGTGKKKGASEDSTDTITKQIMYFSAAEVDAFADYIIETIGNEKDKKKLQKIYKDKIDKANLKLKKLTPDLALFGRMITDEKFMDIDASIQVAHAISTNKMEQEFDFFTAVDDLLSAKEGLESQGSGMMGDVEFTSATFYKYYAIDLDGFIDNMLLDDNSDEKKEQVKKIATQTVKAFLQGAIYMNPSGKQNTFAAHQLPSVVMVELKDKKIPVSYANAFLAPAKPFGDKDLMEVSVDKLVKHVDSLTERYNITPNGRLWFSERDEFSAPKDVEKIKTINDLLDKVEDLIG